MRSEGGRVGDPVVSVVIPAYNAAAHLGEQLAALAAQTTNVPFEVVVADNGSTDDSADVARTWVDRLNLRVVDAAGRRGVSHARNVGVRHTRAGKVLICDADDRVTPEWVDRMLAALRSHDLVGGVSRTTDINDPVVAAWRSGFPNRRLPGAGQFLPFASGANTGFHRHVFNTIGGYDETLVAGGDPQDFSWRAQLAGFSLGFADGAVIDYRFRPGLRALYRQSRDYARNKAALYLRFREHGLRRDVRGVLRMAWWLATRWPLAVVDRRRRGRWVRVLGTLVGRVQGWVRFRAIC